MRQQDTGAEEKLWQKLRAKRFHDLKFRRQVPFSGNYIADFVCPSAKLIIELDGSQHAEQTSYDERRTRFFEQQGYRVLRFWNGDVSKNMPNVLETIWAATVKSPLPAPAQGRGCPSPLQGEGE
jgi:very-short-patch-repair endonuclease